MGKPIPYKGDGGDGMGKPIPYKGDEARRNAGGRLGRCGEQRGEDLSTQSGQM